MLTTMSAANRFDPPSVTAFQGIFAGDCAG